MLTSIYFNSRILFYWLQFPFKECTFTIVKKRKVRDTLTNTKCPPKPKRKLFKDCPPEEDNDKCKRSSSMNNVLAYLMSDDAGDPDNKPKKKCPRVNLGVCKDIHDFVDDPCKKKKRGKTLICPDDLLSKKPRPKKKSSPVLPLGQISRTSRSDTAMKIWWVGVLELSRNFGRRIRNNANIFF